ncbi:MAG: hypothetical protein K2Q29_12460 [Sphingomonadales bacterium]|nr:hypothetical protein [Sphingomonadales bacterium]
MVSKASPVPRKRDYKAEYQRRIANAAKRGLSRSQARGHARAGENSVRAKPVQSDDRLEDALKLLRQTGNQSRAAKEAGVSAERFRRFLRSNALAERQGRQWLITDNRSRRMTVITDGDAIALTLRDFEQSSLNGKHQAAVGMFLRTNDADLLAPFEGRSVIDAAGKAHPLETDPNALYRIDNAGGEEFHQIYRLIT